MEYINNSGIGVYYIRIGNPNELNSTLILVEMKRTNCCRFYTEIYIKGNRKPGIKRAGEEVTVV